jgi:hypothetical protein
LDISENRIAKCYILHDNDEKNKCELTDRRLTIIRKGKRSEFAIENLKSVSVNHRKLLIPIIISGIITPLILVGFFKDLFHPIIALIIIIGGVFLFYIGWIGEKVMTINLMLTYRDFPVSIVTEHLLGFMDYVNQYIQDEPIEKRVLYLDAGVVLSEGSDLQTCLAKDGINRKIYSYWQLRDKYHSGRLNVESSYIVLDPIKVGSEVKYHLEERDRGLNPVIKGSINADAVIKVMPSSEISSRIEYLNSHF